MYSTFTPQLKRADPPRPITTDDLERDRVMSQRIALFGWIEEKHLDVPEGEGSKGFIMFAQQGHCASFLWEYVHQYHNRVGQDQPLQGSSGQADLHFELLQGYIWLESH